MYTPDTILKRTKWFKELNEAYSGSKMVFFKVLLDDEKNSQIPYRQRIAKQIEA